MTDNEIIKALDSVGTANGVVLGPHSGQADIIADRFRELISENGHQKAEIEKLQKENYLLSANADTAFQDGLNEAQELYALQVEGEIKSEVIKEFAERLKENYCFTDRWGKIIPISTIDDLVKEITEGKK